MSGHLRLVNAEAEEAFTRVADTMIDTFNAQLAAGSDAIQAWIEMTAVGYRLAAAVGLARASGAAHELEFYGGGR